MRRVALVVLALACSCVEEKVGPGEAIPIPRTGPPGRPIGGPPAPKPPAPPPEAAAPAPAPEPEPTEPGGVARAKMGELLEFSWSRVSEGKIDMSHSKLLAAAKANAKGGDAMVDITHPKPVTRTGTLTVVRIEPEQPFTFRVEIKSGKDVEQKVYAYAPEISLRKVVFRTEASEPKKKAKAAGMVFDCVQTPIRLIAPDAPSLAMSGGLVSENAEDKTRVGALSVALTRIGKGATAAAKETPKVIDTFEPPIAVAMNQVQTFGVLDPTVDALRAETLISQIAAMAGPCVAKLKPPRGTLESAAADGKLGPMMWNAKPAPKPLEKCIRGKLAKLKLPVAVMPIRVLLEGAR
jgi:hypothetical protein